ncbi:MAG: GTP-binding protein [Nitrososphaerales archaeon]
MNRVPGLSDPVTIFTFKPGVNYGSALNVNLLRIHLTFLIENHYQLVNMVLSIIFAGHVDNGKSTICGHLLKQLNYVTDHDFSKITQDSISAGMEKWKYAYVLDIFDEERESGKTKDYCVTSVNYQGTTFNFIDTPGHKQLVKCMIEGATSADVAVLICSVRKGEFESGMSGQTKEHLYILRGLGVKQLVIVFNKMDTIDWDQDQLQEHQDTLMTFLKNIKFPITKTVAVSGWTGENLLEAKANWGPSLMQVISELKPRTVPETIPGSDVVTAELIFLENIPLISRGFQCIMHVGGKYFSVEVSDIAGKIVVRSKDKARIKLEVTDRPDLFTKNVILRKDDNTIAIGVLI